MAKIIAITGATGFVGRRLALELSCRQFELRRIVRDVSWALAPSVHVSNSVAVGDINSRTDWSVALAGVDCVIHCAARSQVVNVTACDALSAYRVVNAGGSRRLAEQAVVAGVRRLVFLSSIKVNGERTFSGVPFSNSDMSAPKDAYGISKWEAEQKLWDVSAKTGLEVVVVRSPLVYGPGAKGNLAHLLMLVRSGLPLPFGAVSNMRSLIGLDNLVDLLIHCIDHPAASGQTLLVSDGEDLSTPDLLRQIAAPMGCPARLFPVPGPLLSFVGRALGKRAEIDRLVGSLQVDSSHTRQLLEWTPPVSVQEGIRRMVQGV